MLESIESLGLEHAPGPESGPAASVLSHEEQLIVRQAQAGEHRALRQIYATYQAQVRNHVYRLLGHDGEVDDLTQIVFARAFKALDRFQGHSSLSTWLYRITANTTHNLLRQRFRRQRVKAAFGWFHAGRRPCVESTGVEARDEVHRILQLLRPDLREVFVLYHYEGLTLQEISEILDRPISTIGDRLTRARKHLRELVA